MSDMCLSSSQAARKKYKHQSHTTGYSDLGPCVQHCQPGRNRPHALIPGPIEPHSRRTSTPLPRRGRPAAAGSPHTVNPQPIHNIALAGSAPLRSLRCPAPRLIEPRRGQRIQEVALVVIDDPEVLGLGRGWEDEPDAMLANLARYDLVRVVGVKGVQASRNDVAVDLGDRHRRPTQSHHLFHRLEDRHGLLEATHLPSRTLALSGRQGAWNMSCTLAAACPLEGLVTRLHFASLFHQLTLSFLQRRNTPSYPNSSIKSLNIGW